MKARVECCDVIVTVVRSGICTLYSSVDKGRRGKDQEDLDSVVLEARDNGLEEPSEDV